MKPKFALGAPVYYLYMDTWGRGIPQAYKSINGSYAYKVFVGSGDWRWFRESRLLSPLDYQKRLESGEITVTVDEYGNFKVTSRQ